MNTQARKGQCVLHRPFLFRIIKMMSCEVKRVKEERIKGVFSDDQENEYLGVLHDQEDVKDMIHAGKWYKF